MSDQKEEKKVEEEIHGGVNIDERLFEESEARKALEAEGETELLEDGAEKKKYEIAKKLEEVQVPKANDPSVMSDDEVKKNAAEVAAEESAEKQIERIVQIATMDDPEKAIKVAKELDSNFVLDKVHDGLVEDKVREVLIEKGLLKEI